MTETTTAETESTQSHTDSEQDDDILRRVQPTTKPVLIRLGLVVLAAIAVIGVLFTNPTLLGNRDVTNVGLLIVQLLAAIAIVRLLVRLLVLRRTEYLIKADAVSRRYALFLRTNERQVPFNLIRSHEFNQSRVESLLSHGTITLNQGLGDLKLWNIANPQEVYDVIRERAENR